MQPLKQSTVFTERIGPIIDPSGVEYTGAVISDIDLTKNGTTAALAAASTLTHVVNGLYTLVTIAANTDTLGRLLLTCNKAGYQMRPREYTVYTAATYDALVTNAANAAGGLCDVQLIAGTVQTAGDIYGNIGANGASLTAIGDTRMARLDATVSSRNATTPPTAAAIATTIFTDLMSSSDMNTAGSFGALIKSNINAAIGGIPTNPLLTTDTRLNNLDATITSRMATFTLPTGFSLPTYIAGTVPTVGTGTSQLALAGGYVYVGTNNDKSGYSLTAGEHTNIATDAQTGLTAQGYTTVRAGYLDVLNGLLASIWSYGNRVLTGFGFTVNTNANATETAIKAVTDAISAKLPANAIADEVLLLAAISSISGGGGTGANTIVFHILGTGATPIQGATVSAWSGATLSATGTTDASGNVTLSLNSGTYSIVKTFGGYNGTTDSLAVSGSTSSPQTYTLTALTVTPSTPPEVTGYLTCVDQFGNAQPGVAHFLTMTQAPPGSTGNSLSQATKSAVSNSTGLVQFSGLIANAVYQIKRGSGPTTKFTAQTSTFQIPDCIG